MCDGFIPEWIADPLETRSPPLGYPTHQSSLVRPECSFLPTKTEPTKSEMCAARAPKGFVGMCKQVKALRSMKKSEMCAARHLRCRYTSAIFPKACSFYSHFVHRSSLVCPGVLKWILFVLGFVVQPMDADLLKTEISSTRPL